VAAGETAAALTVRATSTVDTSKSGTASVTVSSAANGGNAKGVYIAGYTAKDGKETPCYWLNGTRHELDLPAERNIVDAYAVDITVTAGKVYIVGYYDYYAAPSYRRTICYWIDGIRHDVAEYADLSSVSPYPRAIAVANSGQVYISGYARVLGTELPCFWGILEEDTMGFLSIAEGQSGWASGIAVSPDGLSYIAGDYNSSGRKACYWDGSLKNLSVPEGSGNSSAYDIALSQSGSIFISGTYVNADGGYSPCYWKDGVWNGLDIPEGSDDAYTEIQGIDIANNGSVYIVGIYKHRSGKYMPCYWKDGVLNNLAEAALGDVFDIVVSNNGAVYAAGYCKNNTTNLYVPCYWQGNTLNYLEVPEGASGQGRGVEIIE
jgi:hypothetical protein